jgi:hypothetical protein
MMKPSNETSWSVLKILLISIFTASLTLAGWVGVKQDTRITNLETEKMSAERALVLAREDLTRELAVISERNSEDHARIFTKLDILLQQHGIVIRGGVK